MEELDRTALELFIHQPVSRKMISFLANASQKVIVRSPTVALPTSFNYQTLQPTYGGTPYSRSVRLANDLLPTLEEFITQLVVSSNVQVPTLMSTIVYLTRVKTRLQGKTRGRQSTTHRIFLATLILAAKHLNDNSPKNKHWANYTHINTEIYSFGFTRVDVNSMEKQLLRTGFIPGAGFLSRAHPH